MSRARFFRNYTLQVPVCKLKSLLIAKTRRVGAIVSFRLRGTTRDRKKNDIHIIIIFIVTPATGVALRIRVLCAATTLRRRPLFSMETKDEKKPLDVNQTKVNNIIKKNTYIVSVLGPVIYLHVSQQYRSRMINLSYPKCGRRFFFSGER